MSDKEIEQSLENSKKILEKIENNNWNKENLEDILMPEAEKGKDRGQLLWPLRTALTGQKASAGPFDVAAILGREKTLERIKKAIELLEFDAASYDLSARFSMNKSNKNTFRAKENERRKLVSKLRAVLAKVAA